MTRHTLKCWPEFFEALSSGDKTFEVRQGHDRHYKRGDELLLREWLTGSHVYSGREIVMRVTYVMLAGPFLPGDLWVMSVGKVT